MRVYKWEKIELRIVGANPSLCTISKEFPHATMGNVNNNRRKSKIGEIMKTIKTTKLVNPELLGLAYAVRVTDAMVEHGKEAIKVLGDSVQDKHDALCYAKEGITMLFWSKMADAEPLVKENTSALCYKGDDVSVEIYDKKLTDCDGSGDDSVDLKSILENSGLESADEHVERLADDIKNKRGGIA